MRRWHNRSLILSLINMTDQIVEKVISELSQRKLVLRNFASPQKEILFGHEIVFPKHDERAWFEEYVVDCLSRGMDSENLAGLARESYALLRYKQALASSDGSDIGALFALSHVPNETAKEVYSLALREFDQIDTHI